MTSFELFAAQVASVENLALSFTLHEIASQEKKAHAELHRNIQEMLAAASVLRPLDDTWDNTPHGWRNQDRAELSNLAADALDRWPCAEESRGDREDGVTFMSDPTPYTPGVRTVAEFRARQASGGEKHPYNGILAEAVLNRALRLAADFSAKEELGPKHAASCG